MFLFAGFAVFWACRNSGQATMAILVPLGFEGEYSQNGGPWQSLSESNNFSAYDGDLVLRGKIDPELPEGALLNFYLDHIGISIYLNGQVIYESSFEKYPDMCGKVWDSWDYYDVTAEDVFEIRLHNPHSYGNKDAYNEFLDSVCMGGGEVLKYYYDKQTVPYRSFCVFIIVASIALIGSACGYQLLRLPGSTLLSKLGIMSLLMGAYMYFDVKDIQLKSDRVVLNTYGCQLAIMLAAWMLVAGVAELLHEKRKKIAEIAGYVLMAADFIFIAISLADVIWIYDTGIYWAIIQGTISAILIILCIPEVKNSGKQERFLLVSAVVLLAVLIAELLNARMFWWHSGNCMKAVFSVLFVLLLIKAAWAVAKNYQNSISAQKLREELKNSRVILAMSQIRTHFIFNILNAISGMCAYDPRKADETLVMFSRYLRSNINIMDEDEPETFTKSLEHLEDYIQLEQVRFGEKIKFEKIIEEEDFMIPPLVLQPVTENAIKHGLLHKKEGGTIRLHTWRENGNNIIEISDDGAGFDTSAAPKEGAVGMKNVRFRLEYMVGGTMDVKSIPGEGTTVTITIPKTVKDEVKKR